MCICQKCLQLENEIEQLKTGQENRARVLQAERDAALIKCDLLEYTIALTMMHTYNIPKGWQERLEIAMNAQIQVPEAIIALRGFVNAVLSLEKAFNNYTDINASISISSDAEKLKEEERTRKMVKQAEEACDYYWKEFKEAAVLGEWLFNVGPL